MKANHRADYLIVGAGILGLALAREIKRRQAHAKIIILEKESEPALHASGRNSGVLHAGFYYSPDSLKAKFTAQGNREMRAFCSQNNIAINNCAKVVVARSESDLEQLYELQKRSERVAAGCKIIDSYELEQIDPNAKTLQKALFSPQTATVNPKELCHVLWRELEKNGVELLFEKRFERRISHNTLSASGEIFEFGHLINAAGLYADKIAKRFGFSKNLQILPFKGIYLVNVSAQKNVRTNIYPVPNLKNPFLGVHFTLTADGKEKIGPTAIPALWRENYAGPSNFSLNEFYETACLQSKLLLKNPFQFRELALAETKKYFKTNLLAEAATLVRSIDPHSRWRWGTPGIRAQMLDMRDLSLVSDFVVEGDRYSTHILNAVSPAFTSAFPFAEHIAEQYLSL